MTSGAATSRRSARSGFTSTTASIRRCQRVRPGTRYFTRSAWARPPRLPMAGSSTRSPIRWQRTAITVSGLPSRLTSKAPSGIRSCTRLTRCFSKSTRWPWSFTGCRTRRYLRAVERLKRFFHVAHLHFNNFACLEGIAPFPSWAYEVLFVNKRLGVVDTSRTVGGLHRARCPEQPDVSGLPTATWNPTRSIASGSHASIGTSATLPIEMAIAGRSRRVRGRNRTRQSEPARLRPVGVIRSPLKARSKAPRQGTEGAPDAWLEIRSWATDALHGLTVGDEVIVITWLHRGRRDVFKVHPRSDPRNPSDRRVRDEITRSAESPGSPSGNDPRDRRQTAAGRPDRSHRRDAGGGYQATSEVAVPGSWVPGFWCWFRVQGFWFRSVELGTLNSSKGR